MKRLVFNTVIFVGLIILVIIVLNYRKIPVQPFKSRIPKTVTQIRPTVPSKTNENLPQTTQISIFFVALEDDGRNGEKIGCGDSIVAVKKSIPATITPLQAAMQEMVSYDKQFFGESGFYNALYQSSLTVTKATITQGNADIRLTGTLTLGGVCDNPRVKAQLEKTALQFSTVKTVSIFLNNQPLDKYLSQ